MGLGVEDVEEGKKRKAVAEYVLEYDQENGTAWEEWLQTHRTELNAMTTPQFIEWLDGKMEDYEKLITPAPVLESELDTPVEKLLREQIQERILREAGFEQQVIAAKAAIRKPAAANLAKGIKKLFRQKQEREWRDYIVEIATTLTDHRAD
jgi:hypothetical protein